MRFWLLLTIGISLGLVGCRQPLPWQTGSGTANSSNPWSFSTPRWAQGNNANSNWFGSRDSLAGNDPRQMQLFQGLGDQVENLNRRLGQFDSDNQQLLTDLATTKQKLQAANDYNYQLKQQITDSLAQMQQLQNSKASLEQQLASAQMRTGNGGMLPASNSGNTPSQLAGAAPLRANNSLLQKVALVQLPGVTTRMDGDVIRIELPSDQLFQPNSYAINPNFGQVLQQVATAVNSHFPEQIVGVEAHWDNTPIQPATTTHHQLTASQALAVFDQLRRVGVSEQQLFTMGVGSNRPRYGASANPGGNPNRRVEIVIYPETYTSR
ncbi:MAG: OmpA family protein [Pirellulaceae bacterium]|jgi:flagellar motor protein MotB|nr:OmpA family protein [Pirellulaceae bacterium]